MFALPAPIKEMIRSSLVLFLSFLFVAATTAQAQTLTIGTVQACAAPEVLIPVTGADLQNVGSFTLFIAFDSTLLTYLSLENIDPQLSGVVYSLNQDPFQLAIVWSKVNPAVFQQQKLFDIRFSYRRETTPVTFKQNCEVSNTQLQILPVTFIDGSVVSIIPKVTKQPEDTAVKPWTPATFSINATNAQEYLWKESSNNGQTWTELSETQVYQGTHTNRLTIAWVDPAHNKYRYMCTLNTQNCTVTTMQATVSVDSVLPVPDHAAANDFLLQNKPNPVNGFTIIGYTLPSAGSVTLEILDLCGKIIALPVRETQTAGLHSLRFDASGLNAGLYFYRLTFNNGTSGFTASRKMTKQNN
jgi:hypothetical protein